VSGTVAILSANSVPLRTGAGAANARRSGTGISDAAPPAVAPYIKRLRVRERGAAKGFIDRLAPAQSP
jgi:hypothetical protein